MEKWEEFLARARAGDFGSYVKDAISSKSLSQQDMKVVIREGVKFGEMPRKEIVEKYGESYPR